MYLSLIKISNAENFRFIKIQQSKYFTCDFFRIHQKIYEKCISLITVKNNTFLNLCSLYKNNLNEIFQNG